MHRLSIAKPRSFSDNSSGYLLFFTLFVATVTISNLAIAVTNDFRKSLIALPSTIETCSIDPSKTTNRATLGAHATIAATLQIIYENLAVAVVYF